MKAIKITISEKTIDDIINWDHFEEWFSSSHESAQADINYPVRFVKDYLADTFITDRCDNGSDNEDDITLMVRLSLAKRAKRIAEQKDKELDDYVLNLKNSKKLPEQK